MKVKFALLATVGSMALAGGALAQDNTGYYGALGAGVVLENEVDFETRGTAVPAGFDSELELDTNAAVYGALGKYFSNGLRGELELSMRSQQIEALPGDGLGFAGAPTQRTLGDITATTLMANLYKDFDLDAAGRVSPYLGAGIGAARLRTEFDNVTDGVAATTLQETAVNNLIVVEDTEWVPALQGLAGLTFDFRENMMINVGYRYLVLGEADQPGYYNPLAAETTDFSTEYEAHEATIGLRWNWGAPAAAPAPAPAPVTMKTCFDGSRIPVSEMCPPQIVEEALTEVQPLVVYFDYDKSSLSPASERLIDAKISEVMEGDVTTVTVSGNTDTVGSSRYNQALSARRAAVVKEALISRGVDASVISVEALGESNPAVETADGVKEPLNRRTEVVFDF